MELAFHWQIMKPNLKFLMPGETYSVDSIQYHPDKGTAFSVTPERGVLSPHTDHKFTLSFSPHKVKMVPSWESHRIGSRYFHPLGMFFSGTEATTGPEQFPSIQRG